MVKRLLNAGLFLAAALGIVACSEAPKTTEVKTKAETVAEPAQPLGPVTAKTAYYEMFKPARAWAADFLLLSLAAGEVPGVKSEAGRFPVWTAVFVSPARREARTFTYSVVDREPTFQKGVHMDLAQTWSGATPQSRPFQASEFAVDSDAAYQAALERAGTWVKQHPDKKVAISLANASRFPAPVWSLMWGTKTSGYVVFVNALTGTVVKNR
jgi:hypothetical protein